MSSSDSLPLQDEFKVGEKVFQKLHGSLGDVSAEKAQTEIKTAMTSLMRASILVSNASFFSSNEIVDDIPTPHLRYILIPFYLGELTYNLYDRDPERRLKIVLKTREYFEKFLEDCETIEIIDKDDFKGWEAEQSGKASLMREVKIQRFKREKKAKERITEIYRRRQERKSILSKGKVEEVSEIVEDEYEEMEREATILLIQCHVRKYGDGCGDGCQFYAHALFCPFTHPLTHYSIMDSLRTTKQEVEMLGQVVEMGLKPRDSDSDSRMFQAEKREVKPSTHPQVTSIGPSDREAILAQVFQDHYNPPTESLEALKMAEGEEAMMREEAERNRQIAAEARQEAMTQGEHFAEEDEETLKQREWDDWKDEHPRGEGNRGGNVG